MNMNPWHVEQLAALNRTRIRDEMKQIRLQERAIRSEQTIREMPKLRRSKQLVLVRFALAVLRALTI